MTRSDPTPGGVRYRIGDSLFDPSDGSWTEGTEVRVLPPKAARLLVALAAAAPSVVAKQELLEAAWPGEAASDAALTQRIKELRDILGDDAKEQRVVATAARRGYRLAAPVEVIGRRGGRQIENLLARALAHADRFEWGKAHNLLHAVVEADPSRAVAWAWLAQAHLWREDPEGAATAAARAAAEVDGLDERDRHFVLATRASFAGQLGEMIDQLEMLLAVAPDDFWGTHRLAQAYLLAGRTEDSLRMRERCLHLRPDHPFNLSEAGLAKLFAAGDLEGAAADWARVLELDPRHPFALPYLAPSFRAWLAGDLDAARAALDAVVDRRLALLLPLGRVSALVHDARFRLYLGDAATAVAACERACAEAAPGSSLEGWARLELALTLLDLGVATAARDELVAVADRGTPLGRAQAVLWLGVIAARAGERDGALAAREALQRTPAEACREFGYPTERVTERVRRAFPLLVDAELALHAGDAAAALERFSLAAAALPLWLDAPVPLSTTDPREHLLAREGIARAHAARGNWGVARAADDSILAQRLTLFVRAHGGVGVHFAALARRAQALLRLGRAAEGARDAEAVVERWGGVRPTPPAVSAARAVLQAVAQPGSGAFGAARR
jgi:DNA-binding winged helix-turn-helix (wHTH) protein